MFGSSAHVTADRYRFMPVVTSVTPAGGPKAGGTTVTVKGEGFAPGATSFKVGAGRASGVACSSGGECQLVTPRASAAGTVDIIATVAGVASRKSAADRFTYK